MQNHFNPKILKKQVDTHKIDSDVLQAFKVQRKNLVLKYDKENIFNTNTFQFNSMIASGSLTAGTIILCMSFAPSGTALRLNLLRYNPAFRRKVYFQQVLALGFFLNGIYYMTPVKRQQNPYSLGYMDD